MRKIILSLSMVLAVAALLALPGLAIGEGDKHEHKEMHKSKGAEAQEEYCAHHQGEGQGKKPDNKPDNKLVEEMNILDDVFRDVVSGVALGDTERVYHSLHAMHGTKEQTHEALHKGEIKITKNAHLIKEFLAMDEAFHSGLEELAMAAKAKRQDEMLRLTTKLLGDCVVCHQKFR